MLRMLQKIVTYVTRLKLTRKKVNLLGFFKNNFLYHFCFEVFWMLFNEITFKKIKPVRFLFNSTFCVTYVTLHMLLHSRSCTEIG